MKPNSSIDPLPHQFQRKKRGVAFVHVEHRRINSQPAQQTNASHAEQDFLHDAGRVIAAVDTLREVTKVRLVLRQIGIDEINRAAADVDHPDPELHRLRSNLDFANDRLSLDIEHWLKREIRRVELAVILRLPVVGIDRLLKVAFAVKQAYAHEAQPKVAGRLGMVARQHPQPSGRDRQSLVKTKLRTEIGHRPLGQAGRIRCRPRVGCVQVFVKLLQHGLHAAVKLLVQQSYAQFFVGQLAQHRYGVVIKVAPRTRRKFLKNVLRILIPGPPQVTGQPVQAGDSCLNLVLHCTSTPE